MIEITALQKRYASATRRAAVEALSGLSASVPTGGVTAVVGPNGAGKSTLFALLLGFLHPTSGSIRIDGRSPERYVRAHGAGFLPERFDVPARWPVRSALRAFARLEGLDRHAARDRADDAVERFGLGPHAGKPAGTLSRGLLQRLGLAQADLGRREFVLLDEPEQGLDPLWRIRLREWIAGLADDGRTVLLASHDLAEVERVADRALVLERGVLRETIRLDRSAARTFRIQVERGAALLPGAFPDARRVAGDVADDAAEFEVDVASTAELADGLTAFLSAGGRVVAVQPTGPGLEERVKGLGSAEDGP